MPLYLHTNDSMSSVCLSSIILVYACRARSFAVGQEGEYYLIKIFRIFISFHDINEQDILNYDIHFLCEYQKEHENSFNAAQEIIFKQIKKLFLYTFLNSLLLCCCWFMKPGANDKRERAFLSCIHKPDL